MSYINNVPGYMDKPDLDFLYERAKEMDSIVEIGCWKGRSTHALLSGCEGVVHAVDHFQGSKAPQAIELEKEAPWDEVYSDFMKNVGWFPNIVVHKKKSLEAVREFGYKSVDMVFIDGEHLYDDVKADILEWFPKTRKLICGHDYIALQDVDVIRAVDEIFGPGIGLVKGGRIWYKEL